MKITKQKVKGRLIVYIFAKKRGLLNKTLKMLIILMITILVSTPMGGCANMDKGKHDIIRGISFSPDGKKIIFNRRHDNRPYMIHVYDLETGELAAYQSPKDETWLHPRYSFDGKRIVFIAMPLIEHKEDPANTQIVIMDMD